MKNKVIYIVFTSGAKILSDALNVESKISKIVEVNPTINSLLLRVLRRFSLKFNLFKKFWFNRELKKVKLKSLNNINYKVIIFDSPIWISNIHRFTQVFDKDKVKFWFWNSISNKKLITKIQSQVSNVSCFDQDNCENFNMNFLPQFHLNLDYNLKKEDLIYDVIFVGRVKNRLFEIENLYSECIRLGLNIFFHVKRDNFFQSSKVLSLEDENINYYDYLKLINQSKAILEINISSMSGLSLRAI
jgi:hypothetical protein